MPIRTAKHEPNELRRWGSVAAASGAAVLAGMLAFNAQPSFADSEVRNLDFAEGQPIAYKASRPTTAATSRDPRPGRSTRPERSRARGARVRPYRSGATRSLRRDRIG
jgi:hypothetical protein